MGVARTKLADTIAPGAAHVDSIDPATGETIARFESCEPADVPAIFERARVAQAAWAAQPIRERAAALRRLRDAIFDSRDEIAGVISRETGKPRVEAVFAEIILALDTADFLARRAPKWLRPERVPHHNIAVKAKSGWLEYEPLGVVAIISPWNYPFAIPMAQVIPALAAGNAVVLKPSELTPATGALIGEIATRAKIPANLVQIVQGGGEVGSAVIEAAPDKVFFIGSVETGRKIAEACARKLIPSVLELGGKDAMIVLADADLEIASSAAVWGSFMNCGQACLSVERVYVEHSVATQFTGVCVVKTKKLRLGPPSDPEAEIGPMIRARQLERVERQLQDAAARGAKILTGGERRTELGANFFEPAVVTGVDHSMELMREETFGPVLAIRAVASAAEAVAMANDLPFSLSASVWTRDTQAARKIASQLRAGSVMINDVASYYGISEAPHGGRGASGWGRTHARFGFLEMVHIKYIDIDRLPRIAKSWWYGYSAELAAAADRFVEALFAPSWRRRMEALGGSRRVVFRRDRI
jgi:succinate-semialdehyde dehydrogenase/glutarate-semialdehyde dehydrogenase